MAKLNTNNTFKFFLLFAMSICAFSVAAQKSTVKGKIMDKAAGTPITFANMVLVSESDSSIIIGAITNENGDAKIEDVDYGTYTLKVSFIGYNKYVDAAIVVEKNITNLGNIELRIKPENLEQVDVVSQKKGLYYKVDRKVISADSNPEANSAIDLLENMPSLEVDFEGNLTYRGDGTFVVYINGHLVNNGAEKLRQLSTDKIDRIEIITNPSAKYDAEGTAGIIQVILKRNRLEGFVLTSSLSASTLNGYEWLCNIDKKWDRGGWYFEGNLGNNVLGNSTMTTNQLISDVTNLYETYSVINREQRYKNTYFEFGFNYDLSNKDYIDLMINVNPLKYKDVYNEDGFYEEKRFEDGELISIENSNYDSWYQLDYRYLGSIISYEHAFSKDRSHLLSTFIDISTYLNPLNELKIDEQDYGSSVDKMGYNDKEYNQFLLNYNVNYKNSISEKSKIEIGADLKMNRIPRYTSVSGTFDENDNIQPFSWMPQDQEVDFERNIYAGFATFNSSFGKYEYMLGIRSEYTQRNMNYSSVDVNDVIETELYKEHFIDFFPTVHMVYNFSEEQQVTGSYSRRISRPDYWNLAPISRYESPYAYYAGNNELKPSYASAMEIAYLKSWNDNFFSAELFARNTQGLMQNYYQTVVDNNAILYTKKNVGDSWSLGTELMTGIDLYSWWNTNVSTSLYLYQLKVDVNNDVRTEKQFTSNSGINNTFHLGKTWVLKQDIKYLSPKIAAQLERDAYWYSNMALRKTFNDRKWVFLLSWSNVFNTRKYNTISTGDNFDVNTHFKKESFLTFKVSYRIDNQD